MTVTAEEIRSQRLHEEREFYLDSANLLDFVKDFGAAPDAQEFPHGAGLQWADEWPAYKHDDQGVPLYLSELILWPRGSFKSQVFTVGYVCQRIAKNPDIRIFVASETGKQARKFVNNAMKIIDSARYRELFGVHRNIDGSDWSVRSGFTSQLRSESAMHLKEPTLAPFGVGEVQTGAHWDLGIFDDIISQENTKTPEGIEKLDDWIGDMLAQLDPGSQHMVIGTHHHFADYYSKIKEDPEKARYFRITSHGWQEPDGKLFFPQRLTKDFIERQKKTMTPRLFACFYENQPISKEQQTFLPEYFRVIKDQDIPRAVWTYILTDFAFTSNNANDRCAFWCVSLDTNRVAYVREVLVGRWKPGDSVRILIDMWNRWIRYELKAVTCETGAHDELIRGLAEEVRRQTMTRVNFKPIMGRSEEIKRMRIEGIEPRFRTGDIYFAESFREQNANTFNIVVKEMTQWPFTTHDDIPDAISDLDKKDAKDHFVCQHPPPGWGPTPISRYQPSTINGQWNKAMAVDPREMMRRLGILPGASQGDLYDARENQAPVGADLFQPGRRVKPL